VERRLDEVRALISRGTAVFVDDWEDPFHPGKYRAELEWIRRRFVLSEVARKDIVHVYRLSNLPG
jgi:hypothetical protein